jgi:Dolichyl-phosphate-mannose-protein mannosyltransferase
MRPVVVFFGIALFVVAVAWAVYAQRGEDVFHWSPDGFIYARMMLVDRGFSSADADETARAFYLTKPVAIAGATLFAPNPPIFWRQQPALFRGRVVYPYIASLLYPRFGFSALHLVSALAYVAKVIIMYLLLLRLASPLIAASGTFAFATTYTIHALAGSDSTDMLGLLLWISVLAVMIEFVSSRKGVWLALFVALCAGLAFTRPIMYLPLGASLAVMILGATTRNRKSITAGALLTAGVVVVGIAYLAAGFPGAKEQLSWYYRWQTETHQWPITSFSAFYVHYVARAFAFEAYHMLADGFAWIVAIAGLAFYLNRREPATAILVGSCIAALTVFFVNPYQLELQWAFEMPIIPALTVGNVMAATRLLQPNAESTAGMPLPS